MICNPGTSYLPDWNENLFFHKGYYMSFKRHFICHCSHLETIQMSLNWGMGKSIVFNLCKEILPKNREKRTTGSPTEWMSLKSIIQFNKPNSKEYRLCTSLYVILATAKLSRQKTAKSSRGAWSEGTDWLQKNDQGLNFPSAWLNFRLLSSWLYAPDFSSLVAFASEYFQL